MAPKENKAVIKKRTGDGEMFYIKMKKSRENKKKELKKLKDELRYLVNKEAKAKSMMSKSKSKSKSMMKTAKTKMLTSKQYKRKEELEKALKGK